MQIIKNPQGIQCIRGGAKFGHYLSIKPLSDSRQRQAGGNHHTEDPFALRNYTGRLTVCLHIVTEQFYCIRSLGFCQ